MGERKTRDKLWEALYIEHLDLLKLKVRKFADHEIYEFDSLEELREFDGAIWNIPDLRYCKV